MRIYEAVKAAVPVPLAAEHYGLRVSRNGMTCCPFHEDAHPSLKLNEDYFFCFGCGATGDVIAFAGMLFDLRPREAARKLAADFGISENAKPVPVRRSLYRLEEQRCRRAMTAYLRLQERLVRMYAPNDGSTLFSTQFLTACQQRERVTALLEMLDYACPEERRQTVAALMADGTVESWEKAVAADGS